MAVAALHAVAARAASPYLNVRVDSSPYLDAEEVTIAIDPTNPWRMVAGANLDYVFHSTDAGQTWTTDRMTSTWGVWGDPVVEFDGLGNAYYVHLAFGGSGGANWLDRIVVQRSTDGGATWDSGTGVGLDPPKDQDKAWIRADRTQSPWSGALYLAWTEFDALNSTSPQDSSVILFSHSYDHGGTWSAPVRVSDRAGNSVDSDSTMEGAVPAVGPQGHVYLAWAGLEVIWFDRSFDGGQTWGRDRVIATQPGGWDFSIPGIYRCNGMPVTACDVAPSSPWYGRVYVMFSDQRHGPDNTDVFLMWSDDEGDTWSSLVRVNDDTARAHQFFPSMAVDPVTGVVYVLFYDRRRSAGASDATDVYLATSTDGGATFTNVEISDSSFTPTAGVFFGDYTDIDAYAGIVRPIWMRMDNGDLTVWTAIVGAPTAVADAPARARERVTLEAPVPNPFNPSTTVSFRLAEAADVELAVYDVRGARVRTLLRAHAPAGRSAVRWDGRDDAGRAVASGVYFARLRAGADTRTRRMVLLK